MKVESRVSKGYLTVVPKAIRRQIKISAGDRLSWSIEGQRIVLIPRRATERRDITGMIAHGGDAVASKRRVQRGQL